MSPWRPVEFSGDGGFGALGMGWVECGALIFWRELKKGMLLGKKRPGVRTIEKGEVLVGALFRGSGGLKVLSHRSLS